MRHRLAKIRERLAVILVADTVNQQQYRRIMVLALAVQGTLGCAEAYSASRCCSPSDSALPFSR